mmetsp:Transcript_20082/g.52146  ORF Transcript_20082/g.52146 Transcript_20082/m.52146 type:complete len:337 (-) Transcript_20082:1481-2491(-)
MGERKVLNKYYPPDFDPSAVPRRRMPKDRQYKVRLMAPFNMRCVHCGDYIYKGKKFDAQKETVMGEDYLGLRIFRFYIRCPRCAAAITFKTDPKNTDYVCEVGATRNFENWRVVDDTGEAETAQEEADEQDPMAALARRTEESKREIDILDALEELKDANEAKFNLDIDQVIAAKAEAKRKLLEERVAKQEAEDDAAVAAAFGEAKVIRRVDSSDEGDDDEAAAQRRRAKRLKRDGLPTRPKKEGLHLGATVLKRDQLIRRTVDSGKQRAVSKGDAGGATAKRAASTPAAAAAAAAPSVQPSVVEKPSSQDAATSGGTGATGGLGLGLDYSSSSDE